MKIWLRKLFVVLIACMTLGLYIPPISIETDAESNEVDTPKEDTQNDVITTLSHESIQENASDYVIETLTDKAKDQAYSKLGPRIAKQIENEFMNEILPNIESVLQTILTEAGEEELQYVSITEKPQHGYGERIFNVYDYRTNKDIARFHVRRDNRPLEGYWFNFHYHLSNDGFEEHHEIGEVYWDKNTPPKWMS